MRSSTRGAPVSSGLLSLSIVLLIAAVATGPLPPNRIDGFAGLVGANAPVAPAVKPDLSTVGWFQLDQRLDRDGATLGRTLTVGTLKSSKPTATIDIPEDASATTPVSGMVFFRADDGTTSRLATVSVADGRVTERASLADRVSAATMSADGTAAFYLSAPRSGGSISLWRQSLNGGAATRIFGDWTVPALGIGSFQVVASGDGQSILAQFCGEEGCDGRSVDLASGTSTSISGHELGWVVALDGRDFYSIDHHSALVRQRADGFSSTIAANVASVSAVTGPAGLTFALLRVDSSASLSVLDPAAGTERQMRKEPVGKAGQLPFDLVGGSADRTAGAARTNGWVLITSSGRIAPRSARGTAALLLSTASPTSIDLQQVSQ